MHEYSIVQALFEQIERTAQVNGATAVRRVHLQIGESAGVEVPLLRTAYETFRVGTMCEQAPLDVDPVPVRWSCPQGHGDIPVGSRLSCTTCGRPARMSSGEEIVLDRLELEVP